MLQSFSSWLIELQLPNSLKGSPTMSNISPDLHTHKHTLWLQNSLPIQISQQRWTSWYSNEFIYKTMNSIPSGRTTLFPVLSCLVCKALFPCVHVCLDVGAFVCAARQVQPVLIKEKSAFATQFEMPLTNSAINTGCSNQSLLAAV